MSLQAILKPSALDNKSLNLFCNELTANKLTAGEIITPVAPVNTQLFQLGTPIGSAFPLITTSSPATIVILANPNVSAAPNRYVAPSNQYLFLTVSFVLDTIAGGGQTDIIVFVNNIRSTIVSRNQVNSGGVSQWSGGCSGILQLSAGDVMTIAFANAGYSAGWTYRDFYISGVVL